MRKKWENIGTEEIGVINSIPEQNDHRFADDINIAFDRPKSFGLIQI